MTVSRKSFRLGRVSGDLLADEKEGGGYPFGCSARRTSSPTASDGPSSNVDHAIGGVSPAGRCQTMIVRALASSYEPNAEPIVLDDSRHGDDPALAHRFLNTRSTASVPDPTAPTPRVVPSVNCAGGAGAISVNRCRPPQSRSQLFPQVGGHDRRNEHRPVMPSGPPDLPAIQVWLFFSVAWASGRMRHFGTRAPRCVRPSAAGTGTRIPGASR